MNRRGIVTLVFITALATSSISQNADSLLSILDSVKGAERVDVLRQLAIHTWWTQPERSMDYAGEALSISSKLSDSSRISASLRLIGSVHYYLGDYDLSLNYNQRSLRIASTAADSSLMSSAYNNIGLINYDLGSLETAMENYLRALEISEFVNGEYGVGITYNNIGLIYEKIDNYEEARNYFTLGYDIAIKNANKNAQVYSLNNISHSYLKEIRLDSASWYSRQGLALAKEIGNVNWGAVSLRNLGEVFRLKKQYDSAGSYYQRSLDETRSLSHQKGVAETLVLLAKLSFDRNDLESAKRYLDDSYEIAIQYHWRYELLEIQELYSNLYLMAGDVQSVINKQIDNLDFKDSLYRDIASRNIALLPVKLKEEKNRIDLSRQQAELRRKSFQNKVVVGILLTAVPVVALLIFLLRKLRRTNSELIQNNTELKETRNLLIRSEKMASLGVLAAGVGHEINNPLNYIENGVQAISEQIKEEHDGVSDRLQKYLDIVNKGVDRAAAIVKSLSQFSRSDADDFGDCNIHEIIDNCLVILTNKIRKVEIVKDFTLTNKIVRGNEGRLHQVFMNIILNAGQAVGNDGMIRISTKANNGSLIVSVKDNGMGIAEENILKVNDPFFTTKEPGEGTGLGLFITHSIVEEHRGNIQIISQPNKGAEFIVELPLN